MVVNGRVGYYTHPRPDGYLAVFTGDTVKIPTEEQKQEFQSKNTTRTPSDSDEKEATANREYRSRLQNTSREAVEVNSLV